jgi:ABC-type multidrug transport system fused ATPase/permease subunit
MLTLFRLIDIHEGTIFLDGVDTSGIGLDALRSQLAIIPQDPVLFSGTLRSNLDPWGLHPDAALWEVLARVQLKGAIAAAGGLNAKMAECGDNLSVGQRQLFCLARWVGSSSLQGH